MADYIAALEAFIAAMRRGDHSFIDALPELRAAMNADGIPQEIIDAYSHLVRVTLSRITQSG